MSHKTNKESEWEEARRRCRLSNEAVRMAKEMGLNPRSLINNIPNKSQSWKAPVEDWIRDMYEKRQRKAAQKKARRDDQARTVSSSESSKSANTLNPYPDRPKQAERPARSKRRGKEGALETLDEIRKISKTIKGDEIPDRLYELVELMVERRRECMLYELLENEDLSEEASDMLAFILEDVGYRYPIVLKTNATGGRDELRSAEMIPFGIVFAIAVREEDLARIPTTLPETITQASEEMLLRRACRLGEKPSILLDSHLYHVDHEEWHQESATRTYMKGLLRYFEKLTPSIQPLSREYRKRSIAGFLHQGQELEMTERYCIILRALCAVAIAEEEDENVEATLFGDEATISNELQAWNELGDAISREFEECGIRAVSGIYLYPQAVELWDIPHIGLLLHRKIPLQIALESALDELLATAPEGEAINPSLYVSQHGSRNEVEEIRLAAYTATQGHMFFRYVWKIEPEIDDAEDIADVIIDIANELQATIVSVDGLLPNDRCPECREPIFCGPGNRSVHIHESDSVN